MQILPGKAISGLTVFGPLHFFFRQPLQLTFQSKLPAQEELGRFASAQQEAVLQLAKLYDQAVLEVGPQTASIFAIHAMLLEDSSFVNGIRSIIQEQGATAEYAVRVTGLSFAAAFAALDSPYMQARGADLRDISQRVVRLLLGRRAPDLLGAQPSILVIDELLPSEALGLDRKKLLGLVTLQGSAESHTAMLLRLLDVPGLTGVNVSAKNEGHPAFLDGYGHSLYLDPDEKLLEEMGVHTSSRWAMAAQS